MSELNDLIVAKNSPRLDDDSNLRWYEGDVFAIDWKLALYNANEELIDISPDDTVVFDFYGENSSTKPVASFTFTNIKDNSVTLYFSRAISKKMKAGTYTYCVRFITNDKDDENGESIVTVGANGKVVVEASH